MTRDPHFFTQVDTMDPPVVFFLVINSSAAGEVQGLGLLAAPEGVSVLYPSPGPEELCLVLSLIFLKVSTGRTLRKCPCRAPVS